MAQVGDGLVALPFSEETKEQLEWVAGQVLDAGGVAVVWLAETALRRDGRALADEVRAQRSEEYRTLLAEIDGAAADRRAIARWRRTLRKIELRDHLRAEGRDDVRLRLDELAATDGVVRVR